jgi:hypothetical protein
MGEQTDRQTNVWIVAIEKEHNIQFLALIQPNKRKNPFKELQRERIANIFACKPIARKQQICNIKSKKLHHKNKANVALTLSLSRKHRHRRKLSLCHNTR